MRNFYYTLLCFSINFLIFAQEPATYTVEVPPGTEGVRMTGNFWGWNPIGGPVATINGDNTFTVTLFAGGGESQSDMEYKWVIVDADNVSNPIMEDLIPLAKANGCTDKIDAGELITDQSSFANRFFESTGSDDDKFDVFESCGPYEIDEVYDILVWEDNFSTEGPVNSVNWHHQTQVIIPGVGWANGEAQHYTNRIDNSFVDNAGNLNIVAKKETYTDQGLTKEYTSARLNSKFAFTYGRVDVRAKLPFGDGTWPAIWTLGKNINEDGAYWANDFGTTPWPATGEIDIMEHGLGAINHTSSATHTPSSSGNTDNAFSQVLNDVANNFHVYSMNWSPDQIAFLVDDVIYYIYKPSIQNDDTWPFYKEQFLLLNVAMGGVSGAISPSFTQSSMVIDYVRVYQNASLGLEDNKLKNIEVKTYPNPASNQINIQSDINFDSIRLYSVLGELVLETTGKKQIDVSQISSGLYILKLNNSEKSISLKILID